MTTINIVLFELINTLWKEDKPVYVRITDGQFAGSVGQVESLTWESEYINKTRNKQTKKIIRTEKRKNDESYRPHQNRLSWPPEEDGADDWREQYFKTTEESSTVYRFVRWRNMVVNFSRTTNKDKRFTFGKHYPEIEMIFDASPGLQRVFRDAKDSMYVEDVIGVELNIGDRVCFVDNWDLTFGNIVEFIRVKKGRDQVVQIRINQGNNRSSTAYSTRCLKIDSDIGDNLMLYFLKNGINF